MRGARCSRRCASAKPELNDLATDPLSPAGYDAFILQSRKDSCDFPPCETEPTQPDDDGAGVCPPDRVAGFGSTKTGQSGAALFRR